MELPRDEMAFRKPYEPLLIERSLRTVFRPGNRVYPNWRGYRPGEVVTARVIERVGSDEREIPPTFNETKIRVRIRSIEVLPVDRLDADHFEGSSPDVRDVESLIDHLSAIYCRPIEAYDRQVTRIELDYLD